MPPVTAVTSSIMSASENWRSWVNSPNRCFRNTGCGYASRGRTTIVETGWFIGGREMRHAGRHANRRKQMFAIEPRRRGRFILFAGEQNIEVHLRRRKQAKPPWVGSAPQIKGHSVNRESVGSRPRRGHFVWPFRYGENSKMDRTKSPGSATNFPGIKR